jgi:hypothetical protein
MKRAGLAALPLAITRRHRVLFVPGAQRLRDQLPLRRFDLASSADADERLTVRRLVAKHELRDLDGELLSLVGGNRPAPLHEAVAVVADLAPVDGNDGSHSPLHHRQTVLAQDRDELFADAHAPGVPSTVRLRHRMLRAGISRVATSYMTCLFPCIRSMT